jgi:CIC family chloride channel protein
VPSFTLAVDVVQRSYQLWASTKARFSPTERQRLFGLTVLIGGVCGLVAVAFHQSIRLVERLTIDRAFTSAGDTWIVWVISVPSLGALAAGVMLRYLPGARGSGIPQVKVAYAIKAATLRLRDSLGKFAIAALQIGTGSSLGREGPTVQICAGVARGIGRLGGVSAQNLKLLLPVGSAAGIAAAFNAPIAAVTFTIEEIVGKLDQTLLSGVIVAAALAAVVERSVLGEHPVFEIPKGYGLDHPSSLAIYVALGVAAALVSVAFTDSLLWLRRRFNASARPVWLKPAAGGAVTGALAVGAMLLVHVGGITGGGYDVLGGALSARYPVDILLILGGCKLVATVFSYSSGGAGGIFAPSLFIGAMLGGAFGSIDVGLFGHGRPEVGAFALVGMGAVFAGIVRAPITSVLIILEMTAGYGLTLPLMIANMMAYGLARRLRPTPIYEALLEQDGIQLHTRKPMNVIDGLSVGGIKLVAGPCASFLENDGFPRLLAMIETAGRQDVFPVLDPARRVVGIITLEDLTALAAEPDLGGLVCAADIMRPAIVVYQLDPVTRAVELMASQGVSELPVVDDQQHVLGLIHEAAIAREYMRARVPRSATMWPTSAVGTRNAGSHTNGNSPTMRLAGSAVNSCSGPGVESTAMATMLSSSASDARCQIVMSAVRRPMRWARIATGIAVTPTSTSKFRPSNVIWIGT